MDDTRSLFSLYGKPPLYQLFVSLSIVLGGGILLFSVFFAAGMFIFDADLGSLEITPSDVSPKDIAFFRYVLISQHISLFIIPAIIIMIRLSPGNQIRMTDIKLPLIKEIALVFLLAFCIFPITGFTGELNAGMHLPDWLSGVERWMKEKEEYAAGLEDILMGQNTFRAMMLNIFMIAVIPAIGEEMIFRGVFQKILSDLFRSGHVGIWVTAFVFSALHFQFFGFAPRFILGLVFGYLFLWSGTLWLPVISHFVNNAVSVIAVYITSTGNSNTSLDTPVWQQLVVLPIPIIISISILLYFRNKSKKKAKTWSNEY
jgi:membrane protease YdiL (CAAX protease family)